MLFAQRNRPLVAWLTGEPQVSYNSDSMTELPESAMLTLKESPKSSSTAEAFALHIKEILADEWLPRIYSERILPLRTRAFHFPFQLKAETVEAQRTLLGVELKVGQHRISCPDMATARYLAVFARAGCRDVAVPYDITAIARLADDLEAAWARMLLLVTSLTAERRRVFRSRVTARVIEDVRSAIEEAGAGPEVPGFNQNTKQRQPLV